MVTKQLVVFDWDGTLMDSIARIVSSMQATARHIRLPVPPEQAIRDIIGISLQPAIERLFGVLPTAQFDQFMQRYRDEYVDLNTTPTPLFTGAEAMLVQLRRDHKLAVATGKARRGLDRVWDEVNIRHLFDSSRCADESKGKPDPAMLNSLMEELAIGPEHTVMVGDSVHDMNMARAANVRAIGVDFGAHNAEQLRAAGAEQVISNLAELPSLIAKREYS